MIIKTGLTYDFTLTNGKFTMKTGKDKVDADMKMLYMFFGWFRIFLQDYCVNIYFFFNKHNSFIYRYADIMKLEITRAVDKYLTFVRLEKVNIFKEVANKKELTFDTTYTYTLNTTVDKNRVVFKKII